MKLKQSGDREHAYQRNARGDVETGGASSFRNKLGGWPEGAAILTKTFRLTPSEAKLACIIARGAPPDIAARELKISRETARTADR